MKKVEKKDFGKFVVILFLIYHKINLIMLQVFMSSISKQITIKLKNMNGKNFYKNILK